MQPRRTQRSTKSASTEAPTVTIVTAATTATERFTELLAEEGFRPKVEGDGEDAYLVFKVQGHTFILAPEESDPQFLHLVLNFAPDDERDLSAALARVNRENQRWKALKFIVHDDTGVSIHFESFGLGEDGGKTMILRAIDALNAAAEEFFEGEAS